MSKVISIYESEVVCLNSILELQKSCNNANLVFSADTNKYLLHLTLKKVGASVTQKVVSKLVEKGDIAWHATEDFEVEQILDYIEEDGREFYLIKWKGWNKAHNSWEPKDNLECANLLQEFHEKNFGNILGVPSGSKRKFSYIQESDDSDGQVQPKRTRLDELYLKLVSAKNVPSPLEFMSMTSPKSGKKKSYNGLVTCEGRKAPKLNTKSKNLHNPKTKAYKLKKQEILAALKEWERHLNKVCTDPAPVSVENNVDLEGPPENFEYINDYLAGPGIVIPNDPVIGCECEECHKNKSGCCAAQFGVEFAYNKSKRLKVHPGRPIYECNKRCKCALDCSNRVVQNGRKHKVCVFRTSNGRGWGVKAKQKIKAGTFVMEYVGEVISSDEAEIRGMTYDSVGRTYLFDLDFNGDDCPFTVDAAVYGNVSHFVNHSCDPNLEVYSVWINTLDPRLPRIALFSRRDIEKDEELTFDYMSSKVHSPLEESTNNEEIPHVTKPLVNEAGDSSADDEIQSGNDIDNHSDDSGISSNPSLATGTTNDYESEKRLVLDTTSVVCSKIEPAPSGDASSSTSAVAIKSSPRKAAQPTQYRMVCQCGAKNCRKFVF